MRNKIHIIDKIKDKIYSSKNEQSNETVESLLKKIENKFSNIRCMQNFEQIEFLIHTLPTTDKIKKDFERLLKKDELLKYNFEASIDLIADLISLSEHFLKEMQDLEKRDNNE